MSSHYEAPIRKPLVLGDKSYHDITEDIARPIETPPNKDWCGLHLVYLWLHLCGVLDV